MKANATPIGKIGTFHPTILPATSERVIPATNPIKPPARLKIEDSIKKLSQY
jgi:hypothetical protein